MLRILLAGIVIVLGNLPVHADEAEDQAIAAAEKAGGSAQVDKKLEEGARVAVALEQATDAKLLSLAKQPAIGSLSIEDASRCTPVGYAALRELPNLQKLILGKSAASDKSVAAIGTIKPIQILYLGESKVTDAGLAGLKAMKFLRVLDLYDTKVSDKGLAALAALPAIEEINLAGTAISDKGILVFKDTKTLKLLKTNRTGVSAAGARELETQKPGLTVRY